MFLFAHETQNLSGCGPSGVVLVAPDEEISFGKRAGNPRGFPCPKCGRELPLREPLAGETPKNWECTYCGTKYAGVLIADAPWAMREFNVRAVDNGGSPPIVTP